MANEGKDRDARSQEQQQPHGSTSPQPAQDGGPARNTQGNLGTTQREWVGRDYAADADEEPT